MPEARNKIVVDFGCGLFGPKILKEQGASSIGFDTNTLALQTALKKIDQKSQKLEVADIEGHVPLADGTQDIVFSVNSIEHTIKPHRIIEEMGRVLKTGGKAGIVFLGRKKGETMIQRAAFPQVHDVLNWAAQNNLVPVKGRVMKASDMGNAPVYAITFEKIEKPPGKVDFRRKGKFLRFKISPLKIKPQPKKKQAKLVTRILPQIKLAGGQTRITPSIRV